MTTALAEPAPDTVTELAPTLTPSDAADTDATRGGDNASTVSGVETVVAPVGAVADFRDPRELEIGENVRRSIDLADHPDQVASVREFGVQAPVLVERETDGTLHVLDGQVRVLAAIEAGYAFIPVWITEARTDLTPEQRRIDRAMRQMNLNVRRIALTDSDYAAGVAFMLDLGASATYVANGLQRPRSEVRKPAPSGDRPPRPSSPTTTSSASISSRSSPSMTTSATPTPCNGCGRSRAISSRSWPNASPPNATTPAASSPPRSPTASPGSVSSPTSPTPPPSRPATCPPRPSKPPTAHPSTPTSSTPTLPAGSCT
ncbi:ParB/RepB/Spo0J family partition protein [Nocardia cyriacigeorgica]|uniref:ParB/RepB/Spo0J family partition protein n=1 Tax=Nocardia cyriacigeorgica TaxID=135487 RepID=UPI0024582CC1|nr:ParB/RepB/Spo0J family partition protein [Nocardia cyriacigeorgica]